MSSPTEEPRIPTSASHFLPDCMPSPATMESIREELEAELEHASFKHPHQLDQDSGDSPEGSDTTATPDSEELMGERGLTVTSPGTYEQLEKLTEPMEPRVKEPNEALMEDLMSELSKHAAPLTPGSLASFTSKQGMRASATPSPLSTARSIEGPLSPLGMNPISPAKRAEVQATSPESEGYFEADSPLVLKSRSIMAKGSDSNKQALQPDVVIADPEQHARLVGFAKGSPRSIQHAQSGDSIATEPDLSPYQTPSRLPSMPPNSPAGVLSPGSIPLPPSAGGKRTMLPSSPASVSSPASIPLPPSAGAEKRIQFLATPDRTPSSRKIDYFGGMASPKTPQVDGTECTAPKSAGRRRLTSLPTDIETLVREAEDKDEDEYSEAKQDQPEKNDEVVHDQGAKVKGQGEAYMKHGNEAFYTGKAQGMPESPVDTRRFGSADAQFWNKITQRIDQVERTNYVNISGTFAPEPRSHPLMRDLVLGVTRIAKEAGADIKFVLKHPDFIERFHKVREHIAISENPQTDQVQGFLTWLRDAEFLKSPGPKSGFISIIERLPAALIWAGLLGMWTLLSMAALKVKNFFRGQKE